MVRATVRITGLEDFHLTVHGVCEHEGGTEFVEGLEKQVAVKDGTEGLGGAGSLGRPR
jgi:hypothetical protein